MSQAVFWSSLGAVLGAFTPAAEPVVDGRVMDQTPVIDGLLAVGEWDGAMKQTGFIDPVTGRQTDDRTDVWLAYDADNIYVAYFCHDSQAEGIVARTEQIGANPDGDDLVMFGIDPFNRRSDSGFSRFGVNPNGVKNEDIAGGRSAKREWRGEWSAAARITEDGWTAEMAIPWSVMDLPKGQALDMQINFARIQQRTKVMSFWSDRTERDLPELDGVWRGVTPPKLKAANRLQLQGYIAPEYDEDESPTTTIRSGLDARYKVSSQMTGLVSLSPDFRNIEQEIAGIEFTRTERFVSDSRPFFTEGQSFFKLTDHYSIGRMFHSRRIDDFDIGGKFYGSIDSRNQIGALVTREDNSITDGVFKFNHQIDERSNASLFGTIRDQEGGPDEEVIGGSVELSKGHWGVSYVHADRNFDGGDAQAESYSLSYSIPKSFTIIRRTRADKNFRPELGLVSFDNREGAYVYSQYEAQYRKGDIRGFNSTLFLESFDKLDGGSLTRNYSLSTQLVFRNETAISAGYKEGTFLAMPERIISVGARWNVDNPYSQYGFSFNTGDRDGEDTTFLNAQYRHRFPNRMSFSAEHALLDFMGRTDQTVVGIGWELDETQSVTARLVEQNGHSNWYASYRNAGREGLEWFAIIGDPNSNSFRNRAAIKVVWAR